MTTIDYRPTADRREWNAPGRRVPIITPTTRKISMIPIEANFRIEEAEMQRLAERANGNEELLQDVISAKIPARVDMIALSCYRRLELDAFQAWGNGQIIQRNPENAAQTFTMSFGFPATRYTTAGTAWDNAGVNAYTLFLNWARAAVDLVGPIEGAVLRQAIYDAILADAPLGPNSVPLTPAGLDERIQQDLKYRFEFFIVERTVDQFTDGGLAVTRTKVWPSGKIAAVPQGTKVGKAAFAPVLRAWDIANSVGAADASVDVNGVTVIADVQNAGKAAEFQAQLNAMPVPNETSLYVTNTGVVSP
jgi:hypothetical protein